MQSEQLLPIREVARLTGVNPVTLRAWERRHGLLSPHRTAKGHRLYALDQVLRVQDILHWLARGASVGQVRDLLERQPTVAPQGDWQMRCQQLTDAITQLSSRALDQHFNQVMALYPAVTLCEHLLVPLLAQLAERWRNQFNARLEQVFFFTWLRSKLGARVYHDNQSLEGQPVLIVQEEAAPFSADAWLCAWLLSSSGQPVVVLEQPIGLAQLRPAVAQLRPTAVVLCMGAQFERANLLKALHESPTPILLGGLAVSIHEAELLALNLPALHLFSSAHEALRQFQRLRAA
ncbi:MerR family transcriptional regulator [Pseudomonas cremoricolorata]|uniref:MerR family transcriptional regulator n=1 Tax=Pseudomonas cremoricolorata TaxID=157783 RepID=UPI00041EE580|nr:MerR family transcriptional regulator [Pseudomonas cremoricolorata]